MHYRIKSNKGYWTQGGYGYTPFANSAGVFSAADLSKYDLDGCKLTRVKQQAKPTRLQAAIQQLDNKKEA